MVKLLKQQGPHTHTWQDYKVYRTRWLVCTRCLLLQTSRKEE